MRFDRDQHDVLRRQRSRIVGGDFRFDMKFFFAVRAQREAAFADCFQHGAARDDGNFVGAGVDQARGEMAADRAGAENTDFHVDSLMNRDTLAAMMKRRAPS